ncbi:SDR family oxidoreductase [Haladaptatus sp. DYSN1]|uniref:SDR family oxidoreductase n=1 Tax=unclassified Haladaptatus TaxID=2622732 RepID=UPI0024070226|nr:SDR family oxidoreductase [Haladaptatus sp. DYSN1]
MTHVFFTGFPGFLGDAVLERLLAVTDEETTFTCLVQPRFRKRAERRRGVVAAWADTTPDRVEFVEGDITAEGLGLDAPEELHEAVDQVFHLAAVYDLGVSREVAMAVNRDGTENVLAFAREADADRFHYVSTCYVSGRHEGVFGEEDLDVGQSFNNHYEESKFEAELAVQRAKRRGLATTIYRPAIVVGDSDTGGTQKYDGPYYILQWMLRRSGRVVLPVVGKPSRTEVNLVPRDYVAAAIAHLSQQPGSKDTVYQLCDPDPPTASELLAAFEAAADRRLLRVPLPKFLAKNALDYVPGVYDLFRIHPAVVDYFDHPTSYVCPNTIRDLHGSGIECPPLVTYAPALVSFMRKHPHLGWGARV